jgi:hypothetical protein
MVAPFDEAFSYLRQNNPRGQYLGGSTGARAFDLPMGQFVGKRGDSPAHLQNEFDMNQYLNALGVDVPQAQEQLMDGRPMMLTEFEQGEELGRASPQDIQQLTTDFVPHALISNWDMLGLGRDNVIRRPDGSLTYVDVGGAGPFRAQGGHKGSDFGTSVGELDTLREMNPELAGITQQDIGRSFDEYGGQSAMEDALQYLRDKRTQDIMRQRIQDLTRQVA